MLSGCLENTIKVYGTNMILNQSEQEAIVIAQLEWILEFERKQKEEHQDLELINSVLRVLDEFKPLNEVGYK